MKFATNRLNLKHYIPILLKLVFCFVFLGQDQGILWRLRFVDLLGDSDRTRLLLVVVDLLRRFWFGSVV